MDSTIKEVKVLQVEKDMKTNYSMANTKDSREEGVINYNGKVERVHKGLHRNII